MISIEGYLELRQAIEVILITIIGITSILLEIIILKGLKARQKIQREQVNPRYTRLGSSLLVEPYNYIWIAVIIVMCMIVISIDIMKPSIVYQYTDENIETDINSGIEYCKKIYYDKKLDTYFYIREIINN